MKKRLYSFTLILMLCLMTACKKDKPADTDIALSSPATTDVISCTPVPTVAPVSCISHVDSDDDGYCDVCSESVLVMFDLYAINDLHGKFADSDEQPGVDELTTFFKERFMTDDNPVLLSSGDMWQGSSESNLTRGRILIDWMNELDFVSMTLGNHEFDWGEDSISSNAELAEFPFLAINVYDRDTSAPVSYCSPSVIIERDGVRIGVIGAIGDCYSSISGDRSGGIYFLTGSALTGLVKDESDRLRAEGCDFIVYSIHDGYGGSSSTTRIIPDNKLASYYDVSLSDGYVDLVLEGHTHQTYVLQDRYGVYHLQDGGENDGISHAEIAINSVTGTDRVLQAEFIPSYKYSDRSSDPLRDELLDKYSDILSFATDVLGHTDVSLDRNELRTITAELYYDKGVSVWGDKYDIVLGGGFMSVRSPGYLPAGDITYSDLQAVFPFDNELVLCSVRGSDLRRVFFETTNSNYFMYYSEFGRNVQKSLDPNATYYVVTDSYSSTYAPNRLTEIERLGEEYYARDMLADYFSNK